MLCCLIASNKRTELQRCTNVSLLINVVTLCNHEGAEEALFTMSAVYFLILN